MEELTWNIEQNRKAITSELKEIKDYIASLEQELDAAVELRISDWTGGYVARDIARLTSSLARHHALQETLRMVKRSQDER